MRLEPRRLETAGLVLRPLTAEDEPAVAIGLADPEVLRWTAGLAVVRSPADQRARKWLESRIDGWARGSAVFAVAEAAAAEKMLGVVSVREVNRVPDQATVSYWVSPAARGRRIGARALRAAAEWAFSPVGDGGLGLHRLSLDHALVNEGSCRVATRAGFQLEGTMRDFYVDFEGRRHDSHLHARLATDPV